MTGSSSGSRTSEGAVRELVCRGSEGCQVMSCWDKGLSCVHWISSWDNGLRAWSSGWSLTRFRILHAFQRWRCSRLAPELAYGLKVASGTSIGLRFTSIVFLEHWQQTHADMTRRERETCHEPFCSKPACVLQPELGPRRRPPAGAFPKLCSCWEEC